VFSLVNRNITDPMQFSITTSTDKKTYAGVLEFIAEEGRVYLPTWVGTVFDTNLSVTLIYIY
jgi:ubiquitin fusion degradation protein 1